MGTGWNIGRCASTSINQVTLMGRIGRDPRWATLPGGGEVCNVVLATHETEQDWRTGALREVTHWHRAVLAGSVAQSVRDGIGKGDALYVEGRMRTRKWTSASGDVRYTTEVIAAQVQLYRKAGRTQEDTDGEHLADPDIAAWLADYDVASAKLRAALQELTPPAAQGAAARHAATTSGRP